MLQLSVGDVHTLAGWREGEVYSGCVAGGKGGTRNTAPFLRCGLSWYIFGGSAEQFREGFLK